MPTGSGLDGQSRGAQLQIAVALSVPPPRGLQRDRSLPGPPQPLLRNKPAPARLDGDGSRPGRDEPVQPGSCLLLGMECKATPSKRHEASTVSANEL
jgi:hypothetical protein